MKRAGKGKGKVKEGERKIEKEKEKEEERDIKGKNGKLVTSKEKNIDFSDSDSDSDSEIEEEREKAKNVVRDDGKYQRAIFWAVITVAVACVAYFTHGRLLATLDDAVAFLFLSCAFLLIDFSAGH